MIIGVDMDNTICSTSEKIIEYEKEFLVQKKVSSNELWNDKNLKDEFLSKYLEKIYNEAVPKHYVKKVFDELRNKGNKIYIITARSEKYVSDIFDVFNKYFNKYDIKVDKVFINGKDKVDICLKENVDLMIEDSRYNYNQLNNNNILTILFDEKNKNTDIDNRVSNWKDIIDKITEIL